jgi:hypothetical protein
MYMSVISNSATFGLRNVKDNSLNTRILEDFPNNLMASVMSILSKAHEFIRKEINKMSINIAVYVLFSVLF